MVFVGGQILCKQALNRIFFERRARLLQSDTKMLRCSTAKVETSLSTGFIKQFKRLSFPIVTSTAGITETNKQNKKTPALRQL